MVEGGRSFDVDDQGAQREENVIDLSLAVAVELLAGNAVLGLGRGHPRDLAVHTDARELRILVHEERVRVVNAVFERIQVIRLANVARSTIEPRSRESLEHLKSRRLAFSKIREHQALMHAYGISRDADLGGKGRIFGRLFDTLAGRVIHPPMIEAANAIAFDVPREQRRTAMGTKIIDQMRIAGHAAIERELLPEHPNGLGTPRCDISDFRDRYPEAPKVSPGDRAGAGLRKLGNV